MLNEPRRRSGGLPDRHYGPDTEQAQVDLALRHDTDSVDWAREILAEDPASPLD